MQEIRVLIMTPLPLEFKAVARHLKERSDPLFLDAASYELGTFEGKFHKYSIVVREPGMKNLDMALATEKAIQYFKPQIVLLIGIAGGVKDLKIGDVVIAKKVYGYESGKEDADGIFKSRPAVESFSGELLARAQALSHRDSWKKRTLDGASDAKILIGPIAAGDKVVAGTDNPTYERLKLHYNDTLALEMEAIGFAIAAHYYREVHSLVVRGISDLCAEKAESDKADWQPVAAERAAAFAFELLWQLDASKFIKVPPLPIPPPPPVLRPQPPRKNLKAEVINFVRTGDIELAIDSLTEADVNAHLLKMRFARGKKHHSSGLISSTKWDVLCNNIANEILEMLKPL